MQVRSLPIALGSEYCTFHHLLLFIFGYSTESRLMSASVHTSSPRSLSDMITPSKEKGSSYLTVF